MTNSFDSVFGNIFKDQKCTKCENTKSKIARIKKYIYTAKLEANKATTAEEFSNQLRVIISHVYKEL